ncbi:MAG TPA: hypothetical protein VLF79_02835 [Candidatus Saccharimonadales bacterium]|nr:hypothetical protein [Candidatus Saccharimonadales bacterium]
MAESKKSSAGKKINDVSKPGKTVPSGNSKSVIITNRPIIQDPMVTPEATTGAPVLPGAEKQESESSAPTPKISKPAGELKIKPIAEEVETKDSESTSEPESTKESDTTEESELPNNTSEPEDTTKSFEKSPDEAKPVDTSDIETKALEAPTSDKKIADVKPPEKSTDPAAETVTVAAADSKSNAKEDDGSDDHSKDENQIDKSTSEIADAEQAKAAAEVEAQAKKDEAIDKLAETKQYYLPIDTVEKKRSRRVVALGIFLSLLLIVAWADIALDAGLIKIEGIKPVTHFFSN